MSRVVDLNISGGTVVPMVEDRRWHTGDVLVTDGRIVALTEGPAKDVTPHKVIDASGCLVVPGFVQSHVHVVQSLLRHQADGLELLQWLRDRTWPYEAALDGDGVQAAAELGIAELLCGGTTSILDFGTTHDHERVFETAARMGIRMTSGMTHMDVGDEVPPALLEDRDQSLAEAQRLGERWHGAENGRLGYAVTPRFALSCSRELLEGCVALARDRGWMVHTHASENSDEVAAVRSLFGLSNIKYLDSLGLTGCDVVLAHGVHLDADEKNLLARTDTAICHCPGANLKLASGIAEIPALLNLDIRVGLGADGAPCNNRLSVFHEMALAGTLHGLRPNGRNLDAWTVLAMATRVGARVIGLGERVGTLEVGKLADVAVIDATAWSLLPSGDPASRLVYGANARDVRHVVVDGRVVVEHGCLTTVRPEHVRQHAFEAWRVTQSRMEA
jgi:5-methylthioadenosine/S-adenosylhomocysteine deaminase